MLLNFKRGVPPPLLHSYLKVKKVNNYQIKPKAILTEIIEKKIRTCWEEFRPNNVCVYSQQNVYDVELFFIHTKQDGLAINKGKDSF